MISLQQRSYEKELLDRQDLPFADIRRNMQELDFINRYLGGHAITLQGLQPFLSTNEPLEVLEIGCGGGDNLRAIKRWAERKKVEIRLRGVDWNPACIAFARSVPGNQGISFDCADYRDVKLAVRPHLIFSSLFCHHFTDEELIEMMQWMKLQSRAGFFINDLHRHVLAYYSILSLTKAFSGSYLVKHDAPLSVKRGFIRSEWQDILGAAGIRHFSIQWKWAFRWLITVQHAA